MVEEVKSVPSNNGDNKKTKPKKKMNKQMRSYLIYFAILIVATAFTVFFGIKDDPAEIIGYIKGCNYRFLLMGVGIVFICFWIEGLILMILAKMYKRQYHWWQGTLNNCIGEFFSGITPSSSGGQFVQAYTFSKQGVKVTAAASILFMRFIAFQIVLVVFSFFLFVFKYSEIYKYAAKLQLWGMELSVAHLSIVAFVVNALIIIGLFLLAFSSKLHKFVSVYGIGLLAKLHLVKNKDQKTLELNTKLETFRMEFTRLIQNWKVLIIVIVLFIIKDVLINIIPYFVIRALGGTFVNKDVFSNITDTMSMTLFATSVASYIPIPGASGATEYCFKMVSYSVLEGDGNILNAVILVWRFITYYIPLIVGFIVFLSYHESPKQESLHGSRKTMLQLQIILVNEEKSLTIVDADELSEKDKERFEDLTPENIDSHFEKVKEELLTQLQTNDKAVDKELYQKKKGTFVSLRERRERQLEKRRQKQKAKRDEMIRKAREAEEQEDNIVSSKEEK